MVDRVRAADSRGAGWLALRNVFYHVDSFSGAAAGAIEGCIPEDLMVFISTPTCVHGHQLEQAREAAARMVSVRVGKKGGTDHRGIFATGRCQRALPASPRRFWLTTVLLFRSPFAQVRLRVALRDVRARGEWAIQGACCPQTLAST